MAESKRIDVINLMFDLGEQAQALGKNRLTRPLYSVIANALHASNSPAYVRANYQKALELVDEYGVPTELPVAEPSGIALRDGVRQDNKNEAVVFGVGAAILDRVLTENPGSKAMLAFTFRGITRAGILPRGKADLGFKNELRTGSLRQGGEDFGVGVGVWIPKERTVVAPKNEIVTQHVPVNVLHQRFPGTPLL
jgi:hypothetical protein